MCKKGCCFAKTKTYCFFDVLLDVAVVIAKVPKLLNTAVLVTFSEFLMCLLFKGHIFFIKITFPKSLTSFGKSLVNIMFTGNFASICSV